MYYLVGYMVDKPAVGETVDRLPLHMTVIQWFSSSFSEQSVIDACEQATRNIRTFKLKVLEEARFGTNRDVPVNTVERSSILQDLHVSLLKQLEPIAVHRSPHWHNEDFGPHITHKKQMRLYQGDSLIIDSIDLVKTESIKDAPRTIVTRFYFKT